MDNNKHEEFLQKVYTVLVGLGGASYGMRASFIDAHLDREKCREWRFGGAFGFGGKYRSKTNSIDYYAEDKTELLDKLQNMANVALAEIPN